MTMCGDVRGQVAINQNQTSYHWIRDDCWLVGDFNPFEKYEFVSWDDYSQHMEQMLQTTNQDLIPSGYD